MKVNVTLSIDEELIKEAREQRINVSGTLNKLLRDFLKPKEADYKKEDLTLKIVEFGKSLDLNPEMSIFTHENLDIDATAIWKNFKKSYNPNFSLFNYMEIRKKFVEKFRNVAENQ